MTAPDADDTPTASISPAATPLPRLDRINECIWRGPRRIELSPNAFRTLTYLIERPNQLVAKNALLDAVWPDLHVVDAVLSVTISQLREALDDDPKKPRYIETLYGRGYRWVGQLAENQPTASEDVASMALVGRAVSLADLETAAARAASGRRQLVFITGEPGVGKTALVDHFIAAFQVQREPSNLGSSCLVARGQCIDSYGAGEPYMPMLEGLQHLARTSADVLETLRAQAPTWLSQMSGLLSAPETEQLRRSLASSTGARMIRELQQALETLSSDRTIVIILEDLHWSDPATVAALAGLALRREPARLLIVGTYRPVDAVAELHPIVHLRHELTAKRQCLEIELDGLDVDGVAAYLGARFPNHAFPADVANRLHRQTMGNPLFLLNAVDDLEQRRWLQRCDDVWQCTIDPEQLEGAVERMTKGVLRAIAAVGPVRRLELLQELPRTRHGAAFELDIAGGTIE